MSRHQVPGGALLHVWDPLWLWQLLCLPALSGDPGSLLQAPPGPGQRHRGRGQLPHLRAAPLLPQDRRGCHRPGTHFPSTQCLNVHPDLLVHDLPAPPDAFLQPSARRARQAGQQEREAAVLGPDAQVFQPEGFPEEDLQDLGLWDRYCCPGIPRSLHAPGESCGWGWKWRLEVPLPRGRREEEEVGKGSRGRGTKSLEAKKLLHIL